MQKELILKSPIKINGEQRNTFTYDTDEITVSLFTHAEKQKLMMTGSGKGISGACEVDYNYHLYLGFAAIIAVNPEIDWADLERLKGFDIKEVSGIGRNFIFGRSEELSPDELYDEPSEVIPVPSILPPEN